MSAIKIGSRRRRVGNTRGHAKPAQRVASPTEAQVLALQRAAGNHAATRIIQRRVPDFAAVGPGIMGATPEARRAEKKLKQVIKRTIVTMRARDQKHGLHIVQAAEAVFIGLYPGVDYRTLLDESTPLSDAEKTMLGDVMAALNTAQGAAHRVATEVAYPRPALVVGPPAGPQQLVLNSLVANAILTMRDIAAGNRRAEVTHVFGTRFREAEIIFNESADALDRLHRANAIIVDSRGDQEAVHAGGLTGRTQMALSPEVLAAVSAENQAKIIHESTHAIDNPTTDGAYIDVTPGSAFLNGSEAQKVRRAPYYEAVARGILGLLALPAFTPVNAAAPGGQANAAQAAVEKMVTDAWTVAINARDTLLGWARDQTTAAWTGSAAAVMRQRGTKLANLSRVLGLTVHHRMPANGHAPPVSDLDLTIAEDRAAQIGNLIGKAKNFTAHDPRAWTERWPFGLSTHDYLVERILTQVIAAHGHSRKDAVKEAAMIRALASVYDQGRVAKLMQGVPAPLAGYYPGA